MFMHDCFHQPNPNRGRNPNPHPNRNPVPTPTPTLTLMLPPAYGSRATYSGGEHHNVRVGAATYCCLFESPKSMSLSAAPGSCSHVQSAMCNQPISHVQRKGTAQRIGWSSESGGAQRIGWSPFDEAKLIRQRGRARSLSQGVTSTIVEGPQGGTQRERRCQQMMGHTQTGGLDASLSNIQFSSFRSRCATPCEIDTQQVANSTTDPQQTAAHSTGPSSHRGTLNRHPRMQAVAFACR